MKKLILKVSLITLGVTLILAVSVFGIVSFCAPASMMRFFDSLGLKSISGDYAYQQYQNTNDIEYLARSFELAAEVKNDAVAQKRFEELYGEEGSDRRSEFVAYCSTQTVSALPEGMENYNYRAAVCGLAACIQYRLAMTDEAKEAVCEFVIEESDEELVAESPLVALTIEAVSAKDVSFCDLLLSKLNATYKFNRANEHYKNIISFLEGASHE